MSPIAFIVIELVIELLPQVRGDGKVSALTTIGILLTRPRNTHQALRFADQLPEEKQLLYFQDIAASWSMTDAEGLLKAIGDFPEVAKSRVALPIVMTNENSSKYSDEEIASIEKQLSADDKELLKELKEIGRNNPSPEDLETLKQFYSWESELSSFKLASIATNER